VFTTEHPILVERESVTTERPPAPIALSPTSSIPLPPPELVAPVAATVPVRIRDESGHCWDGLACDHLGHGAAGGPIHLIR
jgi:hypothetical protein